MHIQNNPFGPCDHHPNFIVSPMFLLCTPQLTTRGWLLLEAMLTFTNNILAQDGGFEPHFNHATTVTLFQPCKTIRTASYI